MCFRGGESGRVISDGVREWNVPPLTRSAEALRRYKFSILKNVQNNHIYKIWDR